MVAPIQTAAQSGPAVNPDLDRIWEEIKTSLEATLDAEVAAFNAEVTRLGLEGIVIRREGRTATSG